MCQWGRCKENMRALHHRRILNSGRGTFYFRHFGRYTTAFFKPLLAPSTVSGKRKEAKTETERSSSSRPFLPKLQHVQQKLPHGGQGVTKKKAGVCLFMYWGINNKVSESKSLMTYVSKIYRPLLLV